MDKSIAKALEKSVYEQYAQKVANTTFPWQEGLSPNPDNQNLFPVVEILLAIQYGKECDYGSSWKGKGEYRGIMSNIDRKYDRLDEMTKREIEGRALTFSAIEDRLKKGTTTDVPGEGKVDAIADLANYCLLYLSWVKENYPLVFKNWAEKNIPSYLADKIKL